MLKVKNQHDKKKLIKIKKAVYNKGFYQGVMKVGSAKGQLVKDAKAAVRKEMIQNGQGVAVAQHTTQRLELTKKLVARYDELHESEI